MGMMGSPLEALGNVFLALPRSMPNDNVDVLMLLAVAAIFELKGKSIRAKGRHRAFESLSVFHPWNELDSAPPRDVLICRMILMIIYPCLPELGLI